MTKILWMDLEMSGLNVEKEVIIEVAASVTDLDFEEIDRYHSVIKQPQKYIDAMDDWNREHHSQSGLIDLIPSGKSPDVVENDLIDLVDKNFKGERAVLAGNSIMQDRLFINRYFKKLSEKLHYRMLDVTAWKLIFNNKYNVVHEKKTAHRAVDDIKESIAELKTYLEHVKA